MATKKRRTWKFWVSRTLLTLFLLGAIWLVNLIWFRPFNIHHFYDRAFVRLALRSPETVTSLGVPILYDWNKDKWDDASDAQQWKDFEFMKQEYSTLMRYDFDKQTPANQLNTKILRAYLETILAAEPYAYHGYALDQLSGVHSGMPDLLKNNHRLKTKSDATAYIARLEGFGPKFDQVLERLATKEGKGIIPPRFVIKHVIDELKGFVDPGVDQNMLYTHFVDKVATIEKLSDDEKATYIRQVAERIDSTVFPAYRKMAAYHESLYEKATADDGVWKLPDGDAYYRYMLKASTTTDLDPEDVYQIGRAEVERIGKEMRAILQTEGFTDTTRPIGIILQGLGQEERFLFAESDTGKTQLAAAYKQIVDEASGRLDGAFDIRPRAELTIERVPELREPTEPKAYYSRPSMDGSRGGVFWLNLRKSAEHPKYGMKTLAYHEGIPGHHFQIGIQSELTGLPMFRTVLPFTAYAEGWGLYAEQLAYELGFYEGDPFGNLGRLQAEMWRACRLVVDAGIHYKRWTREQAIAYMVEHVGLSETEATTEVERYIVWPGQACAYKIGLMKILDLRERAKSALGDRFDLRAFHRVVLQNGSVPLDILEEIVDGYIKENS